MNHIVKLDLAKGKAVAETFFHDGYIQWANADNSKNSREPFDGAVLKTRELIGRYADELECRNGIWKFMSRTVMFDWSRIDTIPPHRMPSVEPFKSAFAQGTRLPYKDGSFQKDPSFALLPLFPNPSQTQSDMVNKYQIERLVVAWTRQLDRWINGDPSILNGLVDTYFAAGATVRDGTSSPVSIADYLAALRDLTKKHKVTDRTSVCSNHLISLDPANPNRAVGEHYIDLHLLVPDLSTFNPDPANAGVSGRMWFAGRYVDEYLRGPDGIWRFASRNLVVDWIRLVPHAPGLPPKASDPFTRGNFADPAQDPGVKFIPDAGLIARQPADRDEIERMMAVTDALLTYTRGIDRRDADLITAAYHKGAYDNHGPFQGTAEKFVEWAMAGQKANFGSHHGLTNVVMHFESRTKAKVESRVVDRSLFKDKKTGKEKITWFAGRYLDEVEQRDGVWRIAWVASTKTERERCLTWSILQLPSRRPRLVSRRSHRRQTNQGMGGDVPDRPARQIRSYLQDVCEARGRTEWKVVKSSGCQICVFQDAKE